LGCVKGFEADEDSRSLGFASVMCLLATVIPPGPRTSSGVQIYSQQQLLQMEQKMRDLEDKSKGVASQVLDTYDIRRTLLATRDKDG
jgi:hypothetical protein